MGTARKLLLGLAALLIVSFSVPLRAGRAMYRQAPQQIALNARVMHELRTHRYLASADTIAVSNRRADAMEASPR